MHAFDWYQDKRPWVTLNDHYVLCFKTHAFSQIHSLCENLNEDRPRNDDVAQSLFSWQYKVYADIRGVPWRGGVKNDNGVKENVDF